MGPEARLTFLGHACVALELAGTLLVTDPLLRPRVAFLRWTAPVPRVGPLLPAAAVLLSHLHQDHCDLPSLARLGRHRTLVVPAGTEGVFARRGFTRVVPLRAGESYAVGPVRVTATHAEHDGRRQPFGPRCSRALGYLLSAAGRCVYFAGDTDLFAGMADLAPDLDLALLPVAGWGTGLGPGHLDPVRAAEAARLLRPALAVPIHWGSLQPLWTRRSEQVRAAPPQAFAAEVAHHRLATRVRVLAPGSSLTLPERPGPQGPC